MVISVLGSGDSLLPVQRKINLIDDYSVFYNRAYFDGADDDNRSYNGYTFAKMATGFRSKMQIVQRYMKTGRLLDVGCAKGFFVKIALDAGFSAYGVDFSCYAVEEANKLVGSRVVNADVERDIPFVNSRFDVITAWDFLEHLKNPEDFLEKANKLLNNGGYLFLTTLNHDSLMSRLMWNNWRLKAALHLSDYITPNILRTWLLKKNFKPIIIRTFMISLKPLPKQLRIIQSVLDKVLSCLALFVRILELGDCIFCVAKKR